MGVLAPATATVNDWPAAGVQPIGTRRMALLSPYDPVSWLIVIGMAVPFMVTATVAPVSAMLRVVCTDQPVVDSERVPVPYACIGNGPGGGQATHILPALPVPPMFCMQDAPPWPVDPRPIGPSRFDSTIRR